MLIHRLVIALSIGAVLNAATQLPVHAGDSTEVQVSEFISNPGTIALLGASVAAPLLGDSTEGAAHALRTADAIASATAASYLLKHLTDQPRPGGGGNDSFPSSHAAMSFAAATMAADYNPKLAPYVYGAAGLISYSRVRLRRHHARDVIAGALLGYGMAKLEQRMPRGLLISPFMDPDALGVQATLEF